MIEIEKEPMEPSTFTQRLDCGHTPGELFTFRGPGVFTDHETGEKVCSKCSDTRHYDRVRRQFAEIDARAATEGWAYEYFDTPYDAYVHGRELVGKLVCRAYWRHDPHRVDEARGVLQPAHMYNFAFKRLREITPNSPTTGFALVFENGDFEPLCYDKVCVVTREPAGIDR